TLPPTLSGYLFPTLKTANNINQAAFRYLWLVLRACVWFNVWRVRNDRAFRADLPEQSLSGRRKSLNCTYTTASSMNPSNLACYDSLDFSHSTSDDNSISYHGSRSRSRETRC
ncbi:hypothetical protein ACHHYP_05299, partial [Achlya hypogyna]